MRREFNCRLLVLDVQLPFNGVDLLSQCGLIVNCMNKCLFEGVTSLFTPCHDAPTSVHRVKTISIDMIIDNLEAVFPELTRPTGNNREVWYYTHLTAKQPTPQ